MRGSLIEFSPASQWRRRSGCPSRWGGGAKKGDFRPTMEHESGFPTEFAVLPLLTKVSQSDLSSQGELFGSLVNLYLFPSFLALQKNPESTDWSTFYWNWIRYSRKTESISYQKKKEKLWFVPNCSSTLQCLCAVSVTQFSSWSQKFVGDRFHDSFKTPPPNIVVPSSLVPRMGFCCR